MSDKTLGICFYIVAAVLLIPALTGIFVDSSLMPTFCNRHCWVDKLIESLFGGKASKVFNGIGWLLAALMCFYAGYRARHLPERRPKGNE